MLIPALAVGAAVVGGIIAKTVLSDDSPKQAESNPKAAAQPQTYIVTTSSGKGGNAQAAPEHMSAVQAVNKFVV